MNMKKIGRRISELRKERQLTQEQLAEKLGVSNRSVSRWENGNTLPEMSILLQLCKVLDVGIADLITGEQRTEDTDSEINKNIQILLQLSDRDREEKTKRLNFWFITSAMLLGGTACYCLMRDEGWTGMPDIGTIQLLFFTIVGFACAFTGLYDNNRGRKKETFSEKELSALIMEEKELRMREADEMLQVARKYQHAEFKQYRKAFEKIADDLEDDEYAMFTMVAESYAFNDSPGPWNVSIALTNKRLILCGETVRGMLLTRYVMDEFKRNEIRSVSMRHRKMEIKIVDDTIKLEGKELENVFSRLENAIAF